MLPINFSEADQRALLYERFHHPHPRVQIKIEALWLKSQGAIATIESLTGIRRCPTQVRLFLKCIGMKRIKVGVYPAKADPEVQQILGLRS